mmetsp:Transcript_1588/g.4326  ORF Transcript_1588/g.4326 Transcript_1588/m.4326 type:complete len:170 (-) Transcript_1588:63-572(-)
MSETVLYSYFRSSCAYRVRIALNIKKIPYEMKFVNIYTGEQKDPTYMAVNPSAMVPSLMIDGHMLRQSTAIIEYLEDTRPSAPKLLPNDPHKRAAVREIAEIVACDIQPIQNLRVSAMVADFCQKYQPTITARRVCGRGAHHTTPHDTCGIDRRVCACERVYVWVRVIR